MRKRHWFHLSHYLVLALVSLSLFTVLIPSSAVEADSVVAFPDANLEAAIRDAIGKPAGDIYESDLAGLTGLYASSCNITNLSGLEYCTGITALYLNDNQISDISALAGLTALTELRVGDNEIANISPLAGLTNLTSLLLWNNQISDVSPVSGLTKLDSLFLHGNLLSDISALSSLTKLTYLGLIHNQISDLSPLAGLTSLAQLDLADNQISVISALSGLTGLTILGLQENQISDISPISGLTSLEWLSLSYNQIGNISELASLTSLTGLLLDDNQIGDVSPLSALTSLTWLSLSNNQIGDISPLAGLDGLTVLSVSNNQIGDISPLAGLSDLTVLGLDGNQIDDISPLAGLTSLTSLALDANRIRDLSSLSGLTELAYLLLGDNEIADIKPLVDNPGMASGDYVYLVWNPLNSDSVYGYIPVLQYRGVTVEWAGFPDEPPVQPSNVLPSDGTLAVTLTPTLQSSDFSDPDGDTHRASQWQITASAGDYSSPVFDSDADPSNLTSITVPSLNYATTYYWRVAHQDNRKAWSGWSSETSFTTMADASPPVQPNNVSPDNGATGLGLAVTLEASAFSDLDAGETHGASQWQISAEAGDYSSPVFDSEPDTVHLTSISVWPLSYSTTYYWRVRFRNSHGAWSAWSAETSFVTLANQAPGQPSNVSPANAATGVSLTPRLQSSAFSDPDSGHIHGTSQWQITLTSGNYASTIFDSGVDTAHLTSIDVPSVSLQYATTYYWHVRYRDNYGAWSDWSAETSFTTSTAAPLVVSGDASDVTIDGGRLNGDLTSLGTAGSVTVSFVWGTSSGSYLNETTGQAMTGTGTFYFNLDSLDPGTMCYYRAKAVGHGDPVYGDEKSFATGRSPEVHAVDPVQGKRKQHLTVTITGANLEGATGVSFGSEIAVGDFSVNGSSEITVEIAIDARAAKGMRDVSVTTRWGTATKTGGFSVAGGGGGICSGGALASPGAPSEMPAVLAALGGLFTVGYWIVRKSAKERTEPARSADA
jgi:Leucine-rich repeat (LRR) protein